MSIGRLPLGPPFPSLRSFLARVWFVVVTCAVAGAALRTMWPPMVQALHAVEVQTAHDPIEDRAPVLIALRNSLPLGSKLGYLIDEEACVRAGSDPNYELLQTQFWLAPHALTIFFDELPMFLLDTRFEARAEALLARLPKTKQWQWLGQLDKNLHLFGSQPK